jgi:broad specificity phosphatase PhoE
MSIYVLRHGKSLANEHNEQSAATNRFFGGQSESDLAPSGIVQMKALATKFRGLGISFQHVLSSPAGRARLGAEILLGDMGAHVPVQVCPALSERSSGIIAGKTREQLLVLYPQFAAHFQRDPELRHLRESFDPTGIESFEDYGQVVERLGAQVVPKLLQLDGAKHGQEYEQIALEDDVGEGMRTAVMTHKHTARCLLLQVASQL